MPRGYFHNPLEEEASVTRIRSPQALTSDQGVVYHLKQGRSKQVASSDSFLVVSHAVGGRVLIFPLTISRQRTVRFFTPRPQVALHCRKKEGSRPGLGGRKPQEPSPGISYPFPVLGQPASRAVLLPAGVNGERLGFRVALGLRHHAPIAALAVDLPDHSAWPAAPTAL